jgi:hypothetical protein
MTSPRIDRVEWGKLVIADHTFRDAKLFPGGTREWNWRETNTHHVPGVQRAAESPRRGTRDTTRRRPLQRAGGEERVGASIHSTC